MASQKNTNQNKDSVNKNQKSNKQKNKPAHDTPNPSNPFQFALDSAQQQDLNPYQFALDSVQKQSKNPFQLVQDSIKPQSDKQTPVQAKQGNQSAAQTPVIQRKGSLPEPLKGNAEALGGVDLSDVTVHQNSSQPAQLGAHAYAQGADIHLGPGQDRHLAHETWHVVQQKQGRVTPTLQLKGKVSINDDQGLEQEADIMGQKALQGKFDLQQTQKQAQKQIQGNPIIQSKKKIGETPFKDGYQLLFQHEEWHETANAFEKYLGSYAYNHPDAQAAAHNTLKKLNEVITKYYVEIMHYNKGYTQKSAFLRNAKDSAGQIGLDASQADLDQILTGQGNLRETMTAIYNGAYFRGDQSKDKESGGDMGVDQMDFKNILQQQLFSSEEHVKNLAAKLDLDEASLLKHRKYLMSKERKVLGNVHKSFAPDVYATGNMTRQADKNMDFTKEMFRAQKARKKRTKAADIKAHQKELQYYMDVMAGFSPREATHLMKNTKGTKLPWMEGIAYWKMKDKSSWVKKIKDQLGMPVIAGPSATAARLLNTFRWLKVPDTDIFHFRMAIMGWMLTSQDHSLYEIMRGAHMVGVKAPNETLANAVELYRNIAPFTTDELRKNAGLVTNGMLPHEYLYQKESKKDDHQVYDPDTDSYVDNEDYENKKIKDPGQETTEQAEVRYGGFVDMANGTGYYTAMADWLAQNNTTAGNITAALSPAHATALTGYTGGMYPFINNMTSHSPRVAKKIIYYKLKKIVNHQVKLLTLKNKEAVPGISEAEKNKLKVQITGLEQTPEEWIRRLDPLYQLVIDLAKVGISKEEKTEKQSTLYSKIKAMVEPLYEEYKLHANMLVEALNSLSAVNETVVWRGSGKIIPEKKGNVLSFNKFGSTSREKNKAKEFAYTYKKKKGFTPVLYKLNLKGQGAKDINVFSRYFHTPGDEKEVLLMPGTKFKVDGRSYEGEGKHRILVIEATEIISEGDTDTQSVNDSDSDMDSMVGNV